HRIADDGVGLLGDARRRRVLDPGDPRAASRSAPPRARYGAVAPHPTPRYGGAAMSIAMLVTMCLGFALSISVAVSIGLAALLGTWLSNVNMLLSVKEIYAALNRFPLAAIPFFILAGNLMESGGISRRLVDFAKAVVGGVQGGLAATCVLTCLMFAAVSGSSVATTFAVGAILVPALVKHGYPRTYAAALQATS